MSAVIFFACLPSSPEGYAGQVILNKNPHLWMDTNYLKSTKNANPPSFPNLSSLNACIKQKKCGFEKK